MAKKRTVMRSGSGKKLYAVRDEQGEFTDIQTYQPAQAADMRNTSQAELAKKSAKAMPAATMNSKPAKAAAKPMAAKPAAIKPAAIKPAAMKPAAKKPVKKAKPAKPAPVAKKKAAKRKK